MILIRTAEDERFLLDTAKAQLVFEETTHDLTNATLDMYDVEWSIQQGTMQTEDSEGKVVMEESPCIVFTVRDKFTGLGFEIPFSYESAGMMGAAFMGLGQEQLIMKIIKKIARVLPYKIEPKREGAES